MLTRELALFHLDKGRVIPDRLTRQSHAHYLDFAERMLEIYRRGMGRTRRELHCAIHDVFKNEPACPPRRIEGFAKLLDDAGIYDRDRPADIAALRRQVFHLAAVRHPLVSLPDRQNPQGETKVKADIAAELGVSWGRIESRLFADVMEFHRLQEFTGYPDGQALLSRYNVAQVQAALFDGVSMTVWASQDFKVILRYAKLARLMHTIRSRGAGGYEFRFDGPASILRHTSRYGAALARFLPALLACRAWRLHAVLRLRGRWNNSLDLSADDGFTSHLPPPDEFDSKLEADFADQWGLEKRHGWTLIREGEVLHHGQKVFVPDFVFRHEDGRSVLLEIVGFWTPEYLEAKLRTVRTFAHNDILLAVSAGAAKRLGELPAGTIQFKSRLRIKDVLGYLEKRSR